MQAVASRAAQKVVAQRRVAAARVAPRSTLRVVCQAQSSEVAKKVALVSSLPASLLASAAPAFALVDERLNGDGVGLPLGVNDGALGWVIAGVFTLIWILYFTSQKDLGEFEDADDGLKL